MLKWLPWKFLLQRAAQAYQFMDPVTFLARLRRFSQPSEVQEPIELLRAGIQFHARGLINTKAIQHNLDWVWPFWVEKQFNPADKAFIPRAFSFSHVNLTHRNWTAVGHPRLPVYPIVDPRGLVTPLFDGWSLDFWILGQNRDHLIPARLDRVGQKLEIADPLSVITRSEKAGKLLVSQVFVECDKAGAEPMLNVAITADAPSPARLAVVLRPYNPEGIQFIESARFEKQAFWVNNKTPVRFSRPPAEVHFSDYENGDVFHDLQWAEEKNAIRCKVGMVTAAALFPLEPAQSSRIRLSIPLSDEFRQIEADTGKETPISLSWSRFLEGTAQLTVPDPRMRFLYDAAVRTLGLLSADELVPGPYTYRRFWFRDACLMLNALLSLGFLNRSKRILDDFPQHQTVSGYFRSQEGEWDSNGQVLWIYERFLHIADQSPSRQWLKALAKGAEWILKKRTDPSGSEPHAGLLPAGFSAEHLGPNDFYYWDNFWAVAGLKSAARVLTRFDDARAGQRLMKAALRFEKGVFATIAQLPARRARGTVPASPYRRPDAGAIGSLVADYPLGITGPDNPRIANTCEFLLTHCFRQGAFFQDMIHSGLNAYLTLAVAQTLLRFGDPRYQALIETVADLASPTGQWPEAIHPLTWGGCMGDGQHGWAAAEWALMMRSLFVREEGEGLVFGAGLFRRWLEQDGCLCFGPTYTPWGAVSLWVEKKGEKAFVSFRADWYDKVPPSEIRIPGFRSKPVVDFNASYELRPVPP